MSCLKEEHSRNSEYKGLGMPGKVKEQQKVGRVLLEWDRQDKNARDEAEEGMGRKQSSRALKEF